MTTVMLGRIDPRMRSRRIEVARAAGRKRLRRVVVVAAVLAVVALGWLVTRTKLLDVDRVEVDGAVRTTAAELDGAIAVQPGAQLTDLDLGAVERRVEALPWVDDAVVDRSWSGTVSVSLTERTPVALALTAPDVWVPVDGSGRVLAGPGTVDGTLIRLSGVRAAGEPGTSLDRDAEDLLAAVAALPEVLRTRVVGVDRHDEGVRLSLRSGERIVLGTGADLEMKLVAAATVFDHLTADGATGWELDVSAPATPVVRGLAAPTALFPSDQAAAG